MITQKVHFLEVKLVIESAVLILEVKVHVDCIIENKMRIKSYAAAVHWGYLQQAGLFTVYRGVARCRITAISFFSLLSSSCLEEPSDLLLRGALPGVVSFLMG